MFPLLLLKGHMYECMFAYIYIGYRSRVGFDWFQKFDNLRGLRETQHFVPKLQLCHFVQQVPALHMQAARALLHLQAPHICTPRRRVRRKQH